MVPISGKPEIGWPQAPRPPSSFETPVLAARGRAPQDEGGLSLTTAYNASPARRNDMPAITLDQANRIIAAVLARGAELDCRPLSVIVVEPGCKVKAFQKEDGSSMIRFEMAFGKAYSALAL